MIILRKQDRSNQVKGRKMVAERTKETTCKNCGAKIQFIRTAKSGKWHPIDLPGFHCGIDDDVGSVVLDDGNIVNTTFNRLNRPQVVYNSHMGTCPQSERNKKRDEKKKNSECHFCDSKGCVRILKHHPIHRYNECRCEVCGCEWEARLD